MAGDKEEYQKVNKEDFGDDVDLEKMVSDDEKMLDSSIQNSNKNNNSDTKPRLETVTSIRWNDNSKGEGDHDTSTSPERAAAAPTAPEVGIETNLTSSSQLDDGNIMNDNSNEKSEILYSKRQSTISNPSSSAGFNMPRLDLATIHVVGGAWEGTKKRTLGCRDHNPRTWAILVNILGPLWLLILISVFGGKYLAKLEKPLEVQSNDNIMVNRHLVNVITIENASQRLVELPVRCYQSYLIGTFFPELADYMVEYQRNQTENLNETIQNVTDDDITNNESAIQALEYVYNTTIDDLLILPVDVSEYRADLIYNYIISNVTLPELSWKNFGIFLKELNEHMEGCGRRAADVIDGLLGIKGEGDLLASAQPLTFNWIRCWNTTELGSLIVARPTQAQIEAATNQGSYYEASWTDNQEMLYNRYLAEVSDPGNVTADDIGYALNRSLVEATGDVNGTCTENSSGTAWFWFTVMTTIGYGNQAPVSVGGRLFVALVGFLSIVLFAAILTNAGAICVAIWEDIVGRTKCCRWVRNPIFGCFIWFWITAGWTFFIGNQAKRFWIARGVYDDFVTSKWDPAWFAYISTLTVGLGDYYFPPEVMFMRDIFKFSSTFLVGFVFFATFLGQFLSVVHLHFPEADVGERLKRRLGRTYILHRWCERCLDVGDVAEENDSLYGDDNSDNSIDEDDDEDQKHTIVLDGLTTAEILQKVLQEVTQREESHAQNQQQSDLKDEEDILKQLWKLKKAQQLRILQEEEALLRRLLENNSKQQQGSENNIDDTDNSKDGSGDSGNGGDKPSISYEKMDDTGDKASASKVLLTGDMKV